MTLGDFVVALDLPAGPFVQVAATGVTVTIGGQTMTADVAFQQSSQGLVLAVNNLSLTLGGSTPILTLTKGHGVLAILTTGAGTAVTKSVVGRISGTIALSVPGLELSGPLALAVNTGTAAAAVPELTIEGVTYGGGAPVAPGVAVSGSGMSLVVAGQKISGDFTFVQTGIGTTRKVTLAIANLSAFVGAGADTATTADDAGVLLTGSGSLLLTSAGVAASFSATVTFRFPAALTDVISIGDPAGIAFSVEINNTGLPVRDSALGLDLPAGPFLRIQIGTTAKPFSITVAGQRLAGVFSLEQARTAGADGRLGTLDDATVLKLAVARVELFLGDAVNNTGVRLSNGSALLLLSTGGFAGRVTGSAGLYLGSTTPRPRSAAPCWRSTSATSPSTSSSSSEARRWPSTCPRAPATSRWPPPGWRSTWEATAAPTSRWSRAAPEPRRRPSSASPTRPCASGPATGRWCWSPTDTAS